MVVLKRSFLRSLEALKAQGWTKARSWLDAEVGVGGWWEKQIRGEVEEGGEGECICSQPLGL